jgi:hypothetical protein
MVADEPVLAELAQSRFELIHRQFHNRIDRISVGHVSAFAIAG